MRVKAVVDSIREVIAQGGGPEEIRALGWTKEDIKSADLMTAFPFMRSVVEPFFESVRHEGRTAAIACKNMIPLVRFFIQDCSMHPPSFFHLLHSKWLTMTTDVSAMCAILRDVIHLGWRWPDYLHRLIVTLYTRDWTNDDRDLAIIHVLMDSGLARIPKDVWDSDFAVRDQKNALPWERANYEALLDMCRGRGACERATYTWLHISRRKVAACLGPHWDKSVGQMIALHLWATRYNAVWFNEVAAPPTQRRRNEGT